MWSRCARWQARGRSAETPFDAAAFYREVRITLGRLPEPIRQQVREAHFGGTPASAKRLRDATSDQLLQLGIESAGGTDATAANGGAAVKAAQCYLQKKPVAFEFVVPEVKQWEVMLQRMDLKGRQRMIVIIAAVILLPLLRIFIRGEMESYYQGRWDRMKANVTELDALAAIKSAMFHPWFQGAPVTVQMIDGLVSVFPEQGDVWAKSIIINADGKVSLTGLRKKPARRSMALNDRLRAHPGVTDWSPRVSAADPDRVHHCI